MVHMRGESGRWHYDLYIDGRSATTGAEPARPEPAAEAVAEAAAAVEAPSPDTVALDEARKHRRNGAITGLVLGLVNVIAGVLLTTPSSEPLMSSILVGFLFLGLSLGVYLKSRVCAVLLFGIYAFITAMKMYRNPQFIGVAMAALVLGLLWEGIRGTFAYHKLDR